jgi:D-alanyl-D-alanine carboxypeptidase (penicillin-binding protein 5/6)
VGSCEINRCALQFDECPEMIPRMLSSMKKRILYLLVLISSIAGVWGSAWAATTPPFDVLAREAYLLDLSTNTVLYEKNADAIMPPASMSKLMTVYMVFEALANGEFALEDTFPVSEKAWRMQGSKMFVGLNEDITIADLLRGVIVQSGNDACIVLAEGIAGSEEFFAEMMTDKGQAMGLTGSTFANATGWPHEQHMMTAHDLAKLAQQLIEEFPDYYGLFAEKSFTYGLSLDGKPITQPNRNPILGSILGADGLKTGHTEASGYGLTASAVREGRRLVLVLNGLGSVRQRSISSERFLQWGFRNFETYEVLKAGDVVDEAPVWLGEQALVPLVIAEDLTLTLTRRDRRKMTASIAYTSPIPAGIIQGTPIARLVLEGPDMGTRTIPLLAGTDIEKVGPFGKIGSAVEFLLLGKSGSQ